MQTVEVIGFKRANLGKTASKAIRAEGNVPCVLYGGEKQVHFIAPAILFRELVYTPNAYQVLLNIEGEEHKAILQDAQFHPVSETLLHADFLELKEDRKVKMDIPVKAIGVAPGVAKGGKLVMKLRKLTVRALPQDMPDYIEVNISKLDLGRSAKVGELTPGNYEIVNNPLVSICSIEIPRALRGKNMGDDEEGEDA